MLRVEGIHEYRIHCTPRGEELTENWINAWSMSSLQSIICFRSTECARTRRNCPRRVCCSIMVLALIIDLGNQIVPHHSVLL